MLCSSVTLVQAQPRLFFHGTSLYDHTGVEFVLNGFHFRAVSPTNQPLTTADLTAYLRIGSNEFKWYFSGQPTATNSASFRFRLDRKTEGVATVAEAFAIERSFELQQEGPDTNIITFLLERLSVKPASGFRHELRSRLAAGQATKTLIDLDLPRSTLQPLAVQPAETSVKANLPDAVLTNLPWQGTPLPLTDSDRQQIRDVVSAMQNAFVARDTNTLADLQTVRIQRFAAARRQTDAQFRADLLASYAVLYGSPPFSFDSLDPAQLTFAAYSDSNLVQVEKAGGPPIKATGEINGKNVTFKVPIYVSKLGGVWKIVD